MRRLSSGQASERAPAEERVAAHISAYLQTHPFANRRDLMHFLITEVQINRRQARQVAWAVWRELEAQRQRDAPTFAAADRWIISALRAFANDKAPETVPKDWDAVATRIRYHQVAPLLYERLQALEAFPVPPMILRSFQEKRLRTQALNRGLFRELVRLLQAFREADVAVLLLKGAALGPQLYADIGMRPMGDLDLLVRPQDVPQAEALLQSHGYALMPITPDLRPPEFLRRYGGSAEYACQRGPEERHVDLHWRLTNSEWIRHTTRVDLDRFWAEARSWSWQGVEALQLAPRHHLFYVALHFLKHKFGPGALRMLLDVDRLWRQEGDRMDSASLLEEAQEMAIEAPIWTVLWLCKRWMGTPIPSRVLDALAPAPWRQRYLAQWLDQPEAPITRIQGWPKLGLEFLLGGSPRRMIRAAGAVLFPSREWLIARYALDPKLRWVWWHRLRHPLKVLQSGEL
jgi:hypothetical protein